MKAAFVNDSGFWLRKRFCFCLFLNVFVAQFSSAQQAVQENKLSPILAKQLAHIEGKYELRFRLSVIGAALPAELLKAEYEAKKIAGDSSLAFIVIKCTKEDLLSKVLALPSVLFVENAGRKPVEELQISSLDPGVNRINITWRKYPLWNGEGTTVSVKENKPDTTDIDFTGRYVSTGLSSPTTSSHATIMATMIAGGGNSWHLGKGVAWGSMISSSNFTTLLPDANTSYQQYGISVQNHSYGVGIENYYGDDAAAYDASAINNPSLLHVFSSGNSGTSSAGTGAYAGLQGFANFTGSFKMAKNIITTGAADSFAVVAALSSKGPAYDGRVKPELTAFGEDGSSGAAALVSGAALILQQAYKQTNGALPPSALTKSILINSADDTGIKEVDYANGFGSLNVYNAMKTLQSGRFMTGAVENGNTRTFAVSVPAGVRKLKLTLVWNDPPAVPNAAKALVNDLDLELIHLSSGDKWLPWVLNSFPNADSLQMPATRKKDSLNNAEQITLENPAAGDYQFNVSGYNISTSSQTFYIAYQFDSVDLFEWHYPVENDFVVSSAKNTLRWHSSFNVQTGKLEYSTDGGTSWQTIEESLNISSGVYQWNTPSLISAAILRMTAGGNVFTSDTFTISKRIITGVGFNCPDSFLLYWSRIPGVNNYKVNGLGNRYMETIFATTDSFTVLPKLLNPSLHYSIVPRIGNRDGVSSYTFNYTVQGVECYIRSFLSSLNGNTSRLDLVLGTLYGIKEITLEKFNGTGFTVKQVLSSVNDLNMIFTDAQLNTGQNTYRVKLELRNGKIIYSQPETVYYFSGTEFIVYPNPIVRDQQVSILSNASDDAMLQVFNAYGQKVYQQIINDVVTVIPNEYLSKGLYSFRFTKKDHKAFVLKVIVQ